MEWFTIFGWIAAVLISVFTLPQLYDVLKTKQTHKINGLMYSIFLGGCFCFIVSGFGIMFLTSGKPFNDAGIPIAIANLIGFVIGSIIMSMKLINISKAKKLKISEEAYCESIKKQPKNKK